MSDDNKDDSRKRAGEEQDLDDEEDDDYDEDDDEDEEEEEEERKKVRSKKKKSKRSRLFLDEADEGSSEEEIDDGDAEIDEEEDALDPYEQERRAERISREREFQSRAAEDLAREASEKYRMQKKATEGSRGTFAGGVATVETARLLQERPRASDPKLFMVRCKPGDEKGLVLKLYNKYLRDKTKKAEPVDPNARKSRWVLPPPPGAELEIFSVLAPGTSGFIYVEAMIDENVRAAVRGVPGLYSGTVTVVPMEEMPEVMRVDQKKQILKKGDFVRMRGPPLYKGDLGKVAEVLEGGTKVVVMLVPRIDLGTLKMDVTSRTAAPPAKHYNRLELEEIARKLSNGEDVDPLQQLEGFKFEGEYLLLEVSVRQVQLLTVKPEIQELERFNPASGNQIEDITRDMESIAAKQKRETFEFTIGDRIMVVSGPDRGAQGVLENVDMLRNTGVLKTTKLTLDVRLKDLVKQFLVGDHVKIIAGKSKGKTGTVVSVPPVLPGGRPMVKLITDLNREELQVDNAELKISSEISSGVNEISGYRQHDLVMLDQNVHGVIIGLSNDSVRILTQSGELVEVPPSAIRANKSHESKSAMVSDVNNNPIKQNDSVVVVTGPHRGLEGAVKHVYKMTLFVHCKERQHENSGIVLVKCKDCRIAGTFAPSKGGANGNVNGGMRPPAFAGRGPNGGGAGGGVGGPKDPFMGKMIRIIRGNDKGLVGKVVGGSATSVRVELNARNRIIVVPRENIAPAEAATGTTSSSEPNSTGPRGYGAPYGGQGAQGVQSYATPAAYPTPMSDFAHARGPGGYAPSAAASSASSNFRKGDEVTLVDSGESVTVYDVVNKDLLIKTRQGKLRLVSVNNVVFA